MLSASFAIIVVSVNLLGLIKDFASLMIVSELDNMAFDFTAYGYLGESLYLKTVDAQDIEIDDIAQRQGGRFIFRKLWVWLGLALAFWSFINVLLQVRETWFEYYFYDCVDGSGQSYFNLASQYAQDGICYGGPLSTKECRFEDGDCLIFNMAYPLCNGDELVDVENEVGNGVCNISFAIPGCKYDGGDCCPYDVRNDLSFGDGLCHGGFAATESCGYDNGDCLDFATAYPSCPLHKLVAMNRTAAVVLGDGICDSQVYNITECGYENRDCI